MAVLLWAALAFLIVVLALGTGYAGARALQAWRNLRFAGRELVAALERLMQAAEAAEARVGRVAGQAEELARAVERLQASIARARVLLAAAQEVRDAVAGIRALVPQK